MKQAKPLMIFFIALCFTLPLFAQNGELKRELDQYMQAIRNEQAAGPTPEVFYKTDEPVRMISYLEPYYEDSLVDVRRKAYYITYKVGRQNTGAESKTTFILTNALKDPDSGIVGSVMDYLKSCPRTYYSESAKDTLVNLLHRGTPHYKKLIKLIGYLDIKGEIPYLKQKLRTRDYTNSSERWAILLALSRMGEPQAIDFCLRVTQKMPVGDDFVYEIVPDLIYTRQKKLVDYLVRQLYADAANCSSPNPESTQTIHCGYRIMEFLAPVIVDFPLEVDIAGEIRTDDYKKALKTTRDWFEEHQENYQLARDTY